MITELPEMDTALKGLRALMGVIRPLAADLMIWFQYCAIRLTLPAIIRKSIKKTVRNSFILIRFLVGFQLLISLLVI
jgi:hypothetical protein